MIFRRIAVRNERKAVAPTPVSWAKSAASTSDSGCRARRGVELVQPFRWVLIAATTADLALTPYEAIPVRAKTSAAASVRRWCLLFRSQRSGVPSGPAATARRLLQATPLTGRASSADRDIS